MDAIEAIRQIQETLDKASKDELIAPLEEEMEDAVASIFKTQGKRMLERFAKYKSTFSEGVTPQDFGPDMDGVFAETKRDLETTIREGTRKAYDLGGKEQFSYIAEKEFSEAALATNFDLDNPRAEKYLLQNGADMVTAIDDTTRSQMNTVLEESMKNGWSYDETAEAIQSKFDGFAGAKPQQHIQSRAHLVAVTENAGAFGEGNLEATRQLQEAGLPMVKYWSNTGDSKVSDGCKGNTDAGWIPKKQTFPSGHMHSPRFPSCRCATLHRVKE